jgi:hypothetical protein
MFQPHCRTVGAAQLQVLVLSIDIAIGTTADSVCCWVRLVLAGNSEFGEEKEHIKALLIRLYIYIIPPLTSKESYNPSVN